MKKFITTSLVLATVALTPVSALAQGNQNNKGTAQCRNSECVNECVRKYDGSGKANKNSGQNNTQNGIQNKGENKPNCTQDCPQDCPNDGVRPLDGTGLKKGNNK
ncbi:MAG: hypothetical protein WBH68_06765 [Erysipelotrichaceae bacterium]|nr:hypothetical protein [Bacillota bacterium]NLP21566.1 hypothetical protein [Erysipelotrichaceae bacterium]